MSRLERNGAMVMRGGVIQLADALIGERQIVVPFGYGLFERQRVMDRFDGVLRPADLQGDDADEIVTLRVLRVDRQNRAIQLLSLTELPGAMPAQRVRE